MEKRHVSGSSMTCLVIPGDLLARTDYTPLEKMVLAYDQMNETPETSDRSCAEFLGVPIDSVATARDRLTFLGIEVETHRAADLTEDEYYV